jgi:penicillin-binding protein 1A
MRFLSWIFSVGVLATLAVIGSGFWMLHIYSKNLPDFDVLKNYEPAILSRVYAGDGRLLATFAAEQRIFVPLNEIPSRVREAFLSAEDKDFYIHPGIDIFGIARAILVNLQNIGGDRRPVGASTITQQVAKNMLLSSEVTFTRKIKEALLAFRIENALQKDRILEIYLNQIFLGQHSYGVAAAALNYFNKSLDELSIGETAYLAALPKAPNNYHPVHDAAAALTRRNWVIGRMLEDGKITLEEAKLARSETLQMHTRGKAESVRADYFAEEVRRELVDAYGNSSVLKDGYVVRTSVDPDLQAVADTALQQALLKYDQEKTGWRGPPARLTDMKNWEAQLAKLNTPIPVDSWQLAAVLDTRNTEAIIGFEDGSRAKIPFSAMKWARKEVSPFRYAAYPRRPADVLKEGDVVYVEKIGVDSKDGKKKDDENNYRLLQPPKVQGALVAMDPHTGRVLALVGGFSARLSSFNRATQAMRQTGSTFKPFVYLAALDNGFTPSSMINDAPAVFSQGSGMRDWIPGNFDGEFLGPITLRRALEKSRNVVTVRLADHIGMDKVIEYAKKFGIVNDMPSYLAFSLGAKETTPLRLTAAYSIIANGGKKVLPSFIDRIQDSRGATIWKHDRRACPNCTNAAYHEGLPVPEIPDTREQVNDPRTIYQLTTILEGVVTRGTATILRSLDRTLAGKTGTTNDSKDVWFMGFTPDIVTGVYIGYDDPHPLGGRETGGSFAAPVFKEFMETALKNFPDVPFRVPSGLQLVRVNPYSGQRAGGMGGDTIWEAFLPETDPDSSQLSVLGGTSFDELPDTGEDSLTPEGAPIVERPPAADIGTGGLY